MFEELDIHNQFKESINRFQSHDPHLRRLKKAQYVYTSPLIEEPAFNTAGIYLITGGRQVGKTTFQKQMILYLLKKQNIPASDILFITGEMIADHHILYRIVMQFYQEESPHQYLFVDEVHYIADWDKGIKFMADAGTFENMSVILTGSDSQIIKTSIKRLAGRRGKSDVTDFSFYPLSFKDYVCLTRPDLHPLCNAIIDTPLLDDMPEYEKIHKTMRSLFDEYLLHGGYLPAVNEYHSSGKISKATYNTYIHWIVGDVLKHNKSEQYLIEVLSGIKKTYGSQVSWNRLSKYLSIDHHRTVSDYCHILESIHVIHIQEAIIEHKLTGAPKKDRKLVFRDPFIAHAISTYLNPSVNFTTLKDSLEDSSFVSHYVEAICVDHCKRQWPTYYIKSTKGEVDLALVQDEEMRPIEIKWTKQIRPASLKQINSYENGIVLTASPTVRQINSVTATPLLRFLIQVSDPVRS